MRERVTMTKILCLLDIYFPYSEVLRAVCTTDRSGDVMSLMDGEAIRQ